MVSSYLGPARAGIQPNIVIVGKMLAVHIGERNKPLALCIDFLRSTAVHLGDTCIEPRQVKRLLEFLNVCHNSSRRLRFFVSE